MKKLCPGALLLLMGALPLWAAQAAQPPSKPTPSPTPVPAPVLEGAVKGPDGKPIADALVIARPPFGFGAPAPSISTRTDAEGRFRLTLERAAPHTVRAEARGFAGRTVEKARPGARLDIALTRGIVLEGTVRDGATGQPVPQARVDAQDEGALSLPWEPAAGLVEATSDAKGQFRLEGLGRGLQTVRARARGYGVGSRAGVVPGRTVDIYLFPGSTLSGTVWGPDNAPVAGAIVRAESDSPRFRTTHRPVVSDARGHYEIAGLPPGTYNVIGRHKEFAPGIAASTPVEQGADAEVDLVLEKGAVVSGRLVAGEEPQAVSGRIAVQEVDGRRAPQALRDVLRAEASADGRFRLESVPAGSHVLAVTAPGYAAKRVDVQVAPSARDVNLGDVELEPGLTIRGRVRDRAGLPVAGATIFAGRARPMPARSVQATSEADGTFVLAGLEPGPQRLNVSATGYARIDRQAEAGAEKVEFVLATAGSIAGAVVDDTGRPVEVFSVSARPAKRESNEGIVISTPAFRQVTAADGRFLLEDLAEGAYVVEASAPERASAHVSDVKVVAGGTTDAGTIRLAAGGTIRGSVVDGTSAAVPGAAVRVRGPGVDFMSFGRGPQTVTDSSGAFELRGVPVGPTEVSASHPNYAEGRASGIDVDPAKGAAEARIVLLQGGRVEGWVGRRDGTPLPGVYVSVMPQRGGGHFMGGDGPGMVATNADGTFVVEHLPPGRANVTLLSRSGPRFMSTQSKEVDVRDGEVTQVEFRSREILVSGHVTRLGAPVAGARVSLRGNRMMMMSFGGMGDDVGAAPAGPQRGTAVTAEDGSYELIADEPGRIRVAVESADGRITFPARMADVPDADAFTLELAFNVATIAGVVVDRDTERPVARARVSAIKKNPEPGEPPGFQAGQAGEDGRFQLEMEPGDYKVRASAENYTPAEVETTVGTGGGSELKLALSPGVGLAGKVVDSRGRGVGGIQVMAADPERGAGGGFATTLPDGRFEMGGLRPVPHRLVARSELGGFATLGGVSPGDKDVVLVLRRGGRVSVRVLGIEGQPVAGANVFATDGLGMGASTDARGVAEVMVPAGTSEIRVQKERLQGKTTVTVAEGGSAAAEITLAPEGRWGRQADAGSR